VLFRSIRKQLLPYDNVMNQQREAVYRERDEILSDSDIVERTWGIIADTLSAILERVFADSEEPDIRGASTRLKSIFWPGLESCLLGVETRSDMPEAEEKMKAELRARFGGKVSELGAENASRIFRFVLLQVLDASWREHLLGMDELRRGIGLRAIGQKDPLLEYQFESYNLFQQTLLSVREKVTEYALRVAVVSRSGEAPRRVMRENRGMLLPGSPDNAARAADMAGDAKPRPARRAAGKVGRNDPCPCGSGKKYKHCCGGTPKESAPIPGKV
jgi:preprotein translocase subunit SecA